MSDPATAAPLEAWTCPAPLRDRDRVVMGHGGGGRLTAELVEHLFLPAFGTAGPAVPGDNAVLTVGGARLAFSTDSYVVQPIFFPGGCIGDLAVNGTVNDLAMSGATPLYLSAGFILEEGLELSALQQVAAAMGRAASAAGVRLVTGDTKVVEPAPARGCSSARPASASSPTGSTSARTGCAPATRCSSAGPSGSTASPS